MARDRFLSGPGQVYKRFRNLVFCNLIGQFKLVMVEVLLATCKNILCCSSKTCSESVWGDLGI